MDYDRLEELLFRDIGMVGKDTSRQIRMLVEFYYRIQKHRKITQNQVLQLSKRDEPHSIVEFFAEMNAETETRLKKLMQAYSKSQPTGTWAMGICGIGPVISAGLLAYVNIHECTTVGKIWRYAGLDPTVKWLGRQKAQELVNDVAGKGRNVKITAEHMVEVSERTKRRMDSIERMAIRFSSTDRVTKTSLVKALSLRPWNAQFKQVCWNIGRSFVKQKNSKNDVYGKLIERRKLYEWKKNIEGDYADQARRILRDKNFNQNTHSYGYYAGKWQPDGAAADASTKGDTELIQKSLIPVAEGEGVPMLPPGHIQARSERWGTKLFLSHFHHVYFYNTFGEHPPAPYPLVHLGHTDFIEPPQFSPAESLSEIMKFSYEDERYRLDEFEPDEDEEWGDDDAGL